MSARRFEVNGVVYGSADSKSTKLADVASARREHDTRNNSKKVLARPRVSLSSSPPGPAGQTRYRPTEVSDCGFRARLLLAPASRLPIRGHSEKQRQVLEAEIRVKRIERQEESGRLAERRMAMPDDLGMPNESSTKTRQVGGTNC